MARGLASCLESFEKSPRMCPGGIVRTAMDAVCERKGALEKNNFESHQNIDIHLDIN